MEVSPGKFLSPLVERGTTRGRNAIYTSVSRSNAETCRASRRHVIGLIQTRDRSVRSVDSFAVKITPSAAADNNYSSNVLCGLCQREHAPLGQTRHTWGRRKNSQRVKAVCKTVRDPGAKDPPAIDAMDKTVCSVGRLDLYVCDV